MRFTQNPFTNKFDCVGLGNGVPVEYIEGNEGGPVGPDPSTFTFDLLGDNSSGINTIGDPGSFTLSIFGLASTTEQIGTTAYATNAQAASQSPGTVALTPTNIPYFFSVDYLPSSQGGTGLSSPAAHSLVVTAGADPYTVLGVATDGQLPIGSTDADPVLATLTEGSGINIENGPGTITISATGSGMSWNFISASQDLVSENGYVCVGGTDLLLALPATSAQGDIIEVALDGSDSWTITQAASQKITIGIVSTTPGVTGSLASTNQGDAIRMVCTTANLTWLVLSSMGNPQYT